MDLKVLMVVIFFRNSLDLVQWEVCSVEGDDGVLVVEKIPFILSRSAWKTCTMEKPQSFNYRGMLFVKLVVGKFRHVLFHPHANGHLFLVWEESLEPRNHALPVEDMESRFLIDNLDLA